MKILVAGAGAMGCSFAHKLYQVGNEVFLVDNWGKNIEEIKKNGFKIKDLEKEYIVKLPICKPTEFTEKVDLVILFVKSMMLDSMLNDLQHILDKDTKVLCLLNGLGHIDTMEKYIKEENIVVGITLITAGFKGVANAELTSYAYTEISSVCENGVANAKLVEKVISNTELPIHYTENVLKSIWVKACLNGMFNSICTILDSNLKQLRDVDGVHNVIENIVNEFHSVALYEGVDFDKSVAIEKLSACIKVGYPGENHYPSMHQDLRQNKRHTEIDYLNGYISKKSKIYGINTPYCDLITFQIKALEKKIK